MNLKLINPSKWSIILHSSWSLCYFYVQWYWGVFFFHQISKIAVSPERPSQSSWNSNIDIMMNCIWKWQTDGEAKIFFRTCRDVVKHTSHTQLHTIVCMSKNHFFFFWGNRKSKFENLCCGISKIELNGIPTYNR